MGIVAAILRADASPAADDAREAVEDRRALPGGGAQLLPTARAVGVAAPCGAWLLRDGRPQLRDLVSPWRPDPWPHGVQEDDDLHWDWRPEALAAGVATAARSAVPREDDRRRADDRGREVGHQVEVVRLRPSG